MNNVDKKRNLIKDTMFKLLNNHPYNIVRTKIDRMGRQLMEIDNKFVKLNAN